MCHVCISWFFWCIFLLECYFHRAKSTFFPILWYRSVRTLYLVPPACGVSPSSENLTASYGILCTDHCQQLCVSPSMWSGASQYPQCLCTSARLVWGQLLIQIRLLTKHHFMYMSRCIYVKMKHLYICVCVWIYIYTTFEIKYVSGQIYGLRSAAVASGRAPVCAQVCGWWASVPSCRFPTKTLVLEPSPPRHKQWQCSARV